MAQEKDEDFVDVIVDEDEDDEIVFSEPSVADKVTETDEPVVEPEADESLADHNEDSEHQLTGEETPEEREAIRERRRQERQDRKLKAREREDSLRRELRSRDEELQELRSRVDSIDRRNSSGELAQLANAKQEAIKAYDYYKDQIRVGTESQNGAAVADATEKLFLIRTRIDQLDNIEKAYKQRQTQPPPLDTRIAQKSKSWADSHPWYDPKGRDVDSRVVLTIDQALADEGLNPLGEEYWKELENRVKKYLPHRAVRGNITTGKPKSVVAGSGRETSSTPNRGTFRLSAERVQAMKDMGIYDDPVERNKMIKQYRDYDKNEGAR